MTTGLLFREAHFAAHNGKVLRVSGLRSPQTALTERSARSI